ncbi:hypothetical protein KC901_00835 [Patescibacteria group bacterium]|nr:hypothetical protein [Patescibacteria group bacterium]
MNNTDLRPGDYSTGSMKRVNKALYLLITCGLTLLTFFFFFLFIEWYAIVPALFVLTFVYFDTQSVEPLHRGVQRARWNGDKLSVHDLGPGFYWGFFYSYYLIRQEESTKNPYTVFVIGDVADGNRGILPVTLNIPIVDALKYYIYGGDVTQRVNQEIEDSVKTFMEKKQESELRAIQQTDNGLLKDIFPEHDTFWRTLPEAGLGCNTKQGEYDSITVSVGTLRITKEKQQANEALAARKEYAKAEDFDNKERDKRVDEILIKELLSYITPPITFKELKEEAVGSLDTSGWKEKSTHEKEIEIVDKMLALAKEKLPTDPKDKNYISGRQIQAMRLKANATLDIRENRAESIHGIQGSNAFVNIGQKQNKR